MKLNWRMIVDKVIENLTRGWGIPIDPMKNWD